MKRNLIWLVAILAGIALLTKQPGPPPAAPRPAASPAAASRTPTPIMLGFTYADSDGKDQRFRYQLRGGPGAWRYQCWLSVRTVTLQDEGLFEDSDFKKLVAGLKGLNSQYSGYHLVPPGSPSRLFEIRPTESETGWRFGSSSDRPDYPKLQTVLESVPIWRRRVDMLKEMHARGFRTY